MNNKIKEFAELAAKKIEEIKSHQLERQLKDINTIDTILLDYFTNEDPFLGDLKNRVFFTYSDHYHGNSGTWMSVGQLSHRHTSMDDRGYIKGVATDLDGYVKLRSLLTPIELRYYNSPEPYKPKIRNSKNAAAYRQAIDDIMTDFVAQTKIIAESRVEKANEILKNKTGLSLKNYIKPL